MKNEIKVWDIAVRTFHWSLVLLFTIAYVSGESETLIHIYSGYAVFGLVMFRILWGFIGTKHARFSDFVFGPAVTLSYVKSLLALKPKHYLGHNPLGGWMVVVLLISLLGISWSGLETYAAEGKGPLASSVDILLPVAMANGDDDEEEEHENGDENEFWEDIHEAISEFTLFLIFLHVSGVLIGSLLDKENLIRAMISGYKIKKK